ncbi:proteasome subunit beta type-1-B-like [Hydractinia symbiolongicarpus]|uniref:proteasome subunit beta type-1-B-like n=1 Tax=Hydractinia symbiolongicarpus TaxID=13093 RepID=UPI00254E3BD1|nr:proteasome subunit beta type-1-B-like [Hydractinia symbiolongicarpus]
MVDILEQKAVSTPLQHRFNPYSFHGGTVLAIAGEDYAVIASDTRLSEGFHIHTRDKPKTYHLTDTTILGSCGFHGDVLTLVKNVQVRLKMYEHEHYKTMSCTSIAQMLSTMLYYKRFFPYYTYNIIAGLDKDGKGAVYSYDPVGSYEREVYRATGSSSSMLQSFLDNQIGQKNLKEKSNEPLSKERCVELIKDIFISAAERDIETGDGVHISIITKDGVENQTFPLRRD